MDIVEWLRQTEEELYGAVRCNEAADEIERLRDALHQIYGWYPISISNPRSTIEEMRKFAFNTLKEKE